MVRRWLIGLVIAVVAAVAVFYIARATGDTLTVQAPGQPADDVALPFVIGSVVAAGVAALLVALLIRLTPRPRITFVIVAVVVLLLSFINPFVASERTSTALWLSLMHVVAAIPLTYFLATALPERRQRPVAA